MGKVFCQTEHVFLSLIRKHNKLRTYRGVATFRHFVMYFDLSSPCRSLIGRYYQVTLSTCTNGIVELFVNSGLQLICGRLRANNVVYLR